MGELPEVERARRLEDAARLLRRQVEAGEMSPEAARWYLLGRSLTSPSTPRSGAPARQRLGDPPR